MLFHDFPKTIFSPSLSVSLSVSVPGASLSGYLVSVFSFDVA